MHRTAVHMEYALRHRDMQAVRVEMSNLATEPGLDFALLLDNHDKVMAATRLAWQGRALADLGGGYVAELKQLNERTRTEMTGHVHLSDDRLSLWTHFPVQLPAANGNLRSKQFGVLLARFDLAPAKQLAMHGLEQDIIRFVLALIMVSLLLVIASHMALTRRMQRIIGAAERFAEGQGDARAGLTSHDELGRISRAFDRMAARVQDDAKQLLLLHQCIEHMHEALMITDAKGVIEYANPAFERITGYAVAEVLGGSPGILKSGKHPPEFYQDFWKRISSGKAWSGKMTDKRKDGSLYTARVSVTPVLDEQGMISHYIGMQEDVSGQHKLEERLHQAQKMESLGTLVGGIAHDFNNMLAGILGNIHIAKRYAGDNPKLHTTLERVDKLGYRAADMIKQLLAFARADPVEFKPFDLSEFLREASRLAKVSVPESIAFDVRVPEDEPLTILGDTTQIQQIIMNLVNNARDALATGNGGRIELSLERFEPDEAFIGEYQSAASAYACLKVTDNGEGIPADKLDNIFEPFFTTKPVGEGTGLGLAMIYGAMQRHDGIIRVDSEPGEGTTFSLYFPLSQAASADEGGLAEMADACGERLLLVDDEEVIRDTVAEVLVEAGYRVDVAADGEQAAAIFAENPAAYHAVVTDVVMPVMGGVEAARLMRKVRADIPIVFVTGYDREHVLHEIQDMQRVAALSKPVHPAILQEMLNRIV
ncbi:MAG: ATP-binding protein [Mariprofundaceae bacterium]